MKIERKDLTRYRWLGEGVNRRLFGVCDIIYRGSVGFIRIIPQDLLRYGEKLKTKKKKPIEGIQIIFESRTISFLQISEIR